MIQPGMLTGSAANELNKVIRDVAALKNLRAVPPMSLQWAGGSPVLTQQDREGWVQVLNTTLVSGRYQGILVYPHPQDNTFYSGGPVWYREANSGTPTSGNYYFCRLTGTDGVGTSGGQNVWQNSQSPGGGGGGSISGLNVYDQWSGHASGVLNIQIFGNDVNVAQGGPGYASITIDDVSVLDAGLVNLSTQVMGNFPKLFPDGVMHGGGSPAVANTAIDYGPVYEYATTEPGGAPTIRDFDTSVVHQPSSGNGSYFGWTTSGYGSGAFTSIRAARAFRLYGDYNVLDASALAGGRLTFPNPNARSLGCWDIRSITPSCNFPNFPTISGNGEIAFGGLYFVSRCSGFTSGGNNVGGGALMTEFSSGATCLGMMGDDATVIEYVTACWPSVVGQTQPNSPTGPTLGGGVAFAGSVIAETRYRVFNNTGTTFDGITFTATYLKDLLGTTGQLIFKGGILVSGT